MTNSYENIQTGIIVKDITDHFPTVFIKKMNMFKQKFNTANKYVNKQNHIDDNVARFKKSLSRVNCSEILDGVDANSDFDRFFFFFFFFLNLLTYMTNVFHSIEKNPES